jgi:hypothetical protein
MKVNHPGKLQQHGTITVIVLVLLALITILIAANGRALGQVDKQLRKMEKRQMERLEHQFPPNSASQPSRK